MTKESGLGSELTSLFMDLIEQDLSFTCAEMWRELFVRARQLRMGAKRRGNIEAFLQQSIASLKRKRDSQGPHAEAAAILDLILGKSAESIVWFEAAIAKRKVRNKGTRGTLREERELLMRLLGDADGKELANAIQAERARREATET